MDSRHVRSDSVPSSLPNATPASPESPAIKSAEIIDPRHTRRSQHRLTRAHINPNAAPQRRRPLVIVGSVVASAMVATAVLGWSMLAGATTPAPTVVASDDFSRTVADGFGTADIGGAYTIVSDGVTTEVDGSAGIMSDIAPGKGASASLSSVHTLDTGVQATIWPGDLSKTGSGEYLDLLLRQQTNLDAYRAKLRIDSDGTLALSFSRVQGITETYLGNEVVLPTKLKPNTSVILQAYISGTSTVHLDTKAWASDAKTPTDWQLSKTDTSGSRIATAGGVGVFGYLSRTATAPAMESLTAFGAWDGGIGLTGTGGVPIGGTVTGGSSTSTTGTSPADSTTLTQPTNPGTTTSSTPPPSTGGSTKPPVVAPLPTNSGSAGSAALGSTSYAIPGSAVFVATNGSDSGAGTQSSPYRTLGHAVAAAASGRTIVLRGGDYHESVSIPSNKSFTIQSYPKETVWMDGSSSVSGWTASGSTWIHTGWTASFDSTPNYGVASSAAAFTFVNKAYPMAAHPDQVWVDGNALAQVSSAGAVGPGEFYVDYSGNRLVVGTNPNGHSVDATDLPQALLIKSPNTTVRGIGIRNYGPSINTMGAVVFTGTGATMENVVVRDSATTGISISAGNATLRQVSTQDNGMLGVQGVYADNFNVIGLLSEGNNTEHFNSAPVSGGIKITRSRHITISGGVFRNNEGPGVWCDESSYDIKLVNSKITNNTKHGVAFEISSTAIIANNVVTGNGSDGLKINDIDKVQIWNNQIANNGSNIMVVEDNRRGTNLSVPGHDKRQNLPDPTEPWIIRNIDLMNNIVGATPGYPMYIRDYSGQYSANSLNIKVNGNQFVHDGSALIIWGGSGSAVSKFTSTSAFAAGTGQGALNWELGTTAMAAAAAAAPAAVALPADVAAAIGQPSGVKHLGPFS